MLSTRPKVPLGQASSRRMGRPWDACRVELMGIGRAPSVANNSVGSHLTCSGLDRRLLRPIDVPALNSRLSGSAKSPPRDEHILKVHRIRRTISSSVSTIRPLISLRGRCRTNPSGSRLTDVSGANELPAPTARSERPNVDYALPMTAPNTNRGSCGCPPLLGNIGVGFFKLKHDMKCHRGSAVSPLRPSGPREFRSCVR